MRILLFVFICLFFFVQCTEEKDTTFLITTRSIGKLQKNALVKDLETIYTLDSIVGDPTFGVQTKNPFVEASGIPQPSDSILSTWSSSKKIKIFEKGGAHLLTLTQSEDSIPAIENVRIFDPRFITEKGVGLRSTFKEVKDNYPIQKIVTTMNNVVIYLKNSDMYITIDKKELPSSLRYAASTNIEAVQIPDNARIKYLMIGWD